MFFCVKTFMKIKRNLIIPYHGCINSNALKSKIIEELCTIQRLPVHKCASLICVVKSVLFIITAACFIITSPIQLHGELHLLCESH